jgi:hypothetical protein
MNTFFIRRFALVGSIYDELPIESAHGLWKEYENHGGTNGNYQIGENRPRQTYIPNR